MYTISCDRRLLYIPETHSFHLFIFVLIYRCQLSINIVNRIDKIMCKYDILIYKFRVLSWPESLTLVNQDERQLAHIHENEAYGPRRDL